MYSCTANDSLLRLYLSTPGAAITKGRVWGNVYFILGHCIPERDRAKLGAYMYSTYIKIYHMHKLKLQNAFFSYNQQSKYISIILSSMLYTSTPWVR